MSHADLSDRRPRGFTLIELLVVISIIALLIAILLPSLARARKQSLKVVCGAHLKQVGTAAIAYSQENREHLPPLYRSASSFTTYWMRYPGEGHVGLGVLMDKHYTMTPEIFYCPWKNKIDEEALRHNGPDNDWDGPKLRSSFPSRLILRDDGTPLPASKLTQWRLGDYATRVIYSEFVGVDGFQGGGIASSFIYAPHDAEGFNRLFGDGAVIWANPGPLTGNLTTTAQPALAQALFYEEMDRLP